MREKISRVRRSKQKARVNYNRLSRWYDQVAGSSEAKYRRIGVDTLGLRTGERILEIGFGTGSALVDIATEVGDKGWVCGIDLSDGMASVARDRLERSGLAKRVALIQGDGSHPPIAAASFSAVFISFALELFDTPEIPLVLGECKRVLSQGGRLVVVTMEKQTPPSFAEKVYEWFHHRMPVLVDCRPILAQEALREAGYQIDLVILKKMWGLPVAIIAAMKEEDS